MKIDMKLIPLLSPAQDREKKFIRVSLVSQDEPTIETDGTAQRRWREYVNAYVMTYPTEWVPPAKPRVSPTFLRRWVVHILLRG